MPRIFISGASKGIGRAIARRFLIEGWEVIICARGAAALETARAEMPGLITLPCDMGDKAAVKALAETLNTQFGPLDVLVNNAGIFEPGQIHTEPDERYEQLMRVNMDGTYYLTKGVLPPMMDRKQGTIVNMASIASLNAYENGGSYSITKYALLGFSKNLREEMKPHGIRVISIMPGAVLTASWEGVDVPAERLMPPEDVADLVWTSCALSPRTVVEDIVLRPQLGDL
ncbi:MAG: SDR family oxidoreductase [Bacteroidetes bacterium]|nr:MAG: SDR family oxidoreductase [Bacteroidota bacterium]